MKNPLGATANRTVAIAAGLLAAVTLVIVGATVLMNRQTAFSVIETELTADDTGGLAARGSYPQVRQLKDDVVQQRMNEELQRSAREIVARYQELIEVIPEATVHLGYEVVWEGEQVLSILMTSTVDNGPMTPPHDMAPINLSMVDGSRITLEDLFLGDSNYQEVVADRIGSQLLAMENDAGLLIEDLDWLSDPGQFISALEMDERFLLTPSTIEFHWDGCTIAPCAAGPVKLSIPYSRLEFEELIRPDGPLG